MRIFNGSGIIIYVMTTKDMSKGNTLKVLIMFTLPMILSVSFQQLYNLADSVIAGQMLGKAALAAVSASYPVTMIFMAVGTGLSVGCSVVTSRIYGEKDYLKLKTAVSTAFISFAAIAIICSVAGWFLAEPVLRLLSTPEEIIKDSTQYLAVYVLGLVFVFLYNSCSATFQALGNSNIPLFFLIFSTIFNIALDIIFLYYFKMGVWGLSFATVIAQGLACVLSVIVLAYILTNLKTDKDASQEQNGAEKDCGSEAQHNGGKSFKSKVSLTARSLISYFFARKPYARFKTSVFKEIMIIGVPSVVQTSTVSIGQLFVQNLVNTYGTDVVAGYGAAIKIQTFCIQLLVTVGNALSIFVSQNIGAAKPERIKKGVFAGLGMISVLTVVIVPLIMIFASPLLSVFTDGDSGAAVIEIGRSMIMLVTPFYLFAMVKFITDAVLKGSGAMLGFISATMADLILRVGFAYVFSYLMNSYVGIWWSWPLGWVVGAVVSALFYFFGHWKKRAFGVKSSASDFASSTAAACDSTEINENFVSSNNDGANKSDKENIAEK